MISIRFHRYPLENIRLSLRLMTLLETFQNLKSVTVNIISIDTPVITNYTDFVVLGEDMYVEGLSYPDSVITLELKTEGRF